MQCKCGGDCPTDIEKFTVKQVDECLSASYPLKPISLPATLRTGVCKACGRRSLSFYYEANGVKLTELVKVSKTSPKPKSNAKPLWGKPIMNQIINPNFDIISKFVEELTSAKGGDKKIVLQNYANNADVFRYIKLVLDPSLTLYQKLDDKMRQPFGQFSKPAITIPSLENGLIAILEFLRLKAIAKETRGDNGVALFRCVYTLVPKQYHNLIDCFVLRNLKAGAGAKTINSIVPKTVMEIGYQRCESGTKQMIQQIIDQEGEVYIQEKEDGMFLNAVTDKDGLIVDFYSRSGNILKSKSLSKVAMEIEVQEFCSKVLLGECLVFENGLLLDRKTGNGLLNSIIQTGEDIGDEYEIVYMVWDYVERETWEAARNNKETKALLNDPVHRYTPYSYNYETLELIFSGCKNVKPVWNKRVTDVSEAISIFKDILKRGGEGIVAKSPKNYWFDGTSQTMLKFKAVIEADFICVGVNEADANGKYAGMVGSLEMESHDGLIRFGCSGMTDEFRKEVTENPQSFIGGVFAVKFNQIITNETDPSIFSVTFPRLASEKRLDKLEANTYDEVIKIIESYFESL